jgi:ribosome-associated protein
MAVGSKTLELTKIAADALAEKLGAEIVAIDLSEQLVLNQVFLLVTGNNEPQ